MTKTVSSRVAPVAWCDTPGSLTSESFTPWTFPNLYKSKVTLLKNKFGEFRTTGKTNPSWCGFTQELPYPKKKKMVFTKVCDVLNSWLTAV